MAYFDVSLDHKVSFSISFVLENLFCLSSKEVLLLMRKQSDDKISVLAPIPYIFIFGREQSWMHFLNTDKIACK